MAKNCRPYSIVIRNLSSVSSQIDELISWTQYQACPLSPPAVITLKVKNEHITKLNNDMIVFSPNRNHSIPGLVYFLGYWRVPTNLQVI